jgi:hypothetical protein
MAYEIRRIEHAVAVGTTLSMSWFRGHSKAWGNLTPRIFRAEWGSDYRQFRPDVERSMLDSFQRSAPAVLTSLPPRHDYPLWLLFMQHHGTPTRLLDWSESILVALYFVVSADPSDEGEIWVLYPDALNRLNCIDGMPTLECRLIQYLAKEFAHNRPAELAKEYGFQERPKYPLAFRPPLLFPRMAVQQSAFTIHPDPALGTPITDLLKDPCHLVRYTVPAECKRRLREDLSSLGINRGTIFPDLDGLSQTIVEQHKIVLYTPPEPPTFNDGLASELRSLNRRVQAPNPAAQADG